MKKHKFKKILKILLKSSGKIFSIFIGFLFVIKPLIAQSLEKPTSKEELNYIRLLCYSDIILFSTIMSIDEYQDLLENSERIFKIDTLKTKGFENVVFYKVSFREREELNLFYDELEKKGNFIRKIQYLQGAEKFVYPFLSKQEYVFASSSFGMYKLKGFRINDFHRFYADCFNTGDCFSDKNIRENRRKFSDKKIIKSLYVEGLDLWKLYRFK